MAASETFVTNSARSAIKRSISPSLEVLLTAPNAINSVGVKLANASRTSIGSICSIGTCFSTQCLVFVLSSSFNEVLITLKEEGISFNGLIVVVVVSCIGRKYSIGLINLQIGWRLKREGDKMIEKKGNL